MMAILVTKNLFGRYSIKYDCPQCKSRLTSPLNDAGKTDNCPDCGAMFLVPGVDERRRILAEHERVLAEHQVEKQRKADKTKQARVAREQRMAAERAKAKEVMHKQRAQEAEQQKEMEHQRVAGTTRRCPFCAEEILYDSTKCKYCKEFLPSEIAVATPAKSETKKTSIWLWCLLGLFFVAFCSQAARETRKIKAPGISSSDEFLIIGAAQDGIRRILKSPSTASFPSKTLNQAAYTITAHSSDSCTVSGYVDAQNSFGATLRNYWTVDCERNGQFWFARNPTLLGQ